jgi:indolepyruvate ferredoxin oxidoreductase
MIVESISSAKGNDQNSVVEVSLDNREDLDAAILAACCRKGLSIILVNDGIEPQFDIEKLSESANEIDHRGFRPQHSIVIPVEQMAAVRIAPIEPLHPIAGVPAMPLESTITSRWDKNQKQKIRFSLRPLLERVEVTRIKPPVRVVAQSTKRVSPPQPIHASSPTWRVHIAGSRGDQPGVVGKILMEAGSKMGYEICSQCNSAFVGAGRRAWTQILYTRKQTTRSFRPLVASIPWGEADLLLGWDREEVLRSIDPKRPLQVASPQRTYAIINSDPLERQSTLADVEGLPANLDISTIASSCKTDSAVVRSFASLARYRFHNERLGDVIQLGMAFQQGLIPVTVDAINVAVASVEKEGYARSIESFNFGRQVALDPENAWQPVKEEFQVDLSKMMKRLVRDYYKLGKRGIAKAETIEQLIRRAMQSLSGLAESSEGRQVMVDLINGIRRCMLWGGEDTANLFLNSIQKLYDVDRAETGRLLTRKAVLPIAEVILIRDPIYLAQLARSPEILRRIRARLNVRLSRGDTLRRRFLSRIRIGLWNWSLQIDLRTSNWSSAIVSWFGKLVPKSWRGHRRNRAIRDEVLEAVVLASREPEMYEVWIARFEKLHSLALSDNLQKCSLLELKKILQG